MKVISEFNNDEKVKVSRDDQGTGAGQNGKLRQKDWNQIIERRAS